MTLGEAEALVKEGRPVFGSDCWIVAKALLNLKSDFLEVRELIRCIVEGAEAEFPEEDWDEAVEDCPLEDYVDAAYGRSYRDLKVFLQKAVDTFTLSECLDWTAELEDLQEMFED